MSLGHCADSDAQVLSFLPFCLAGRYNSVRRVDLNRRQGGWRMRSRLRRSRRPWKRPGSWALVVSCALLTAGLQATPAPAAVQFVSQFGGPPPGTFNNPMDVAADPAGDFYVADAYNNRVQKFDGNGNLIAVIGTYGDGDGQFSRPSGLGTDSAGNLYVADRFNYRIQKFDPNGNFLMKWGSSGGGNGQFNSPTDVAVDPSGNVYVADFPSSRIQKFDAAGSFVTKWDIPGDEPFQSGNPTAIDTDAAGHVYVAEQRNDVVREYDGNGNLVHGYAGLQSPAGVAVKDGQYEGYVFATSTGNNRIYEYRQGGYEITSWPVGGGLGGMDTDPAGNLYVTDPMTNRVLKYDVDPCCGGTFVAGWGSSSRDTSLFSPTDVAIDPADDVYVADYGNNGIQKFDDDGGFITRWGSPGTAAGQFDKPYGVGTDASGDVYVADWDNDRVQKFDGTGNVLPGWSVTAFALHRPYDAATDAAGNVYIVDSYNHALRKVDANGNPIGSWGGYGSGDGQFKYPAGVTVDAVGNVFVADYDNNRIQKFTPGGAFITKWGSYGTGNSQFIQPRGIAVNSSGNVYVADSANNRIQKFSGTGSFIEKWGSLGGGEGQFNYPSGVTIDADGKIYVADTKNDRVQKFTQTAVATSYPRPGSGSPVWVSLVPAYDECSTPNSQHVPPLAVPSCRPPLQTSHQLTTSTTGKQSAFARFTVMPGNSGTEADEADIGIEVWSSDVRNKGDGSDYTGSVILRTLLRITDRANDPADAPATSQDAPFSVPIGCTATPANAGLGSRCSISTTSDTLLPGFAQEDKRAVISALSVSLLDAGADASITPTAGSCPPSCGTGDEDIYLEQGLFTP